MIYRGQKRDDENFLKTKYFGQKTLEEKYLEWVNDWLTIDAMADNYGLTKEQLMSIINKGREEHINNSLNKIANS
jgi:hypothetical protein